CGALVFGRLRELLATLGPPVVAATTLAWGLLLWWAYFVALLVVSEPLRWLLAIPAWLVLLGAARVIQRLWRGEHPPDLVGTGDVLLRVRNARKVYGDPPRLVRDVRRLDRWKAIALRGGLSSTDVRSPAAARRALLWQAGALGLLGYLHVLAQSAW